MKMMSILAAVLLAPCALAQMPDVPAGTIQFRGEEQWVDAPPTLPAGTKVLRLEGDPRAEGIFTMRLKLPAGARLDPHWHPRDERVTILSGEARVGFGDVFDEKAMTSFTAGNFYVNPAKSHHYVFIAKETVMQLTGVGPWELHFIDQGQ